jgi:hypothetical protein
MRVELLYIEGCPNVAPTMDRLRHTLEHCGIQSPIIQVLVDDADHARTVQFLGSPILTRGLEELLFEVKPLDPATMAIAPAVLLGAALLAARAYSRA